jgi:hypothetical protein
VDAYKDRLKQEAASNSTPQQQPPLLQALQNDANLAIVANAFFAVGNASSLDEEDKAFQNLKQVMESTVKTQLSSEFRAKLELSS